MAYKCSLMNSASTWMDEDQVCHGTWIIKLLTRVWRFLEDLSESQRTDETPENWQLESASHELGPLLDSRDMQGYLLNHPSL